MQGYYNDPEATAEAIDAEGWLHTGDIGNIDERGYLFITGRQKDVYIVGGFNCYPAEIEAMMAKHPAVAEVAVVGVPDHRMGEIGKAFVVARPDGDRPDAAEIIDWCRQNMANFKVPRSVVLVDALPRTSTGKVQKFRLQAGEFG
jgi:acyl-CoA synthetase (AMP-forming)/AMP-acid ligase II